MGQVFTMSEMQIRKRFGMLDKVVIDLSGEWVSADYIEVLLLLDENWVNLRTLKKHAPSLANVETSEFRALMSQLEKNGYVEIREGRYSGKPLAEYRRAISIPRQKGLEEAQ